MNSSWKRVFITALFIGGIVSLFASSSPDGLEKVAEEQGFLGQGKRLFVAAFSDYLMPGIHNEKLATSLAGIIGTIAVFVGLLFIGKLLYACEPKENRQVLMEDRIK